jgi:hypothetical protein
MNKSNRLLTIFVIEIFRVCLKRNDGKPFRIKVQRFYIGACVLLDHFMALCFRRPVRFIFRRFIVV